MLQIRMTDLSVNEFNLLYTDDCVSYWYNNKEWKINQWERKCYKKWQCGAKRFKWNIQDMPSSSSSDESESDSSAGNVKSVIIPI